MYYADLTPYSYGYTKYKDALNGEYIVQWNGKTYSSPTLIVHYIDAHNYRPPQEFIDAVMNFE
jgi:hypothetical protein